MRRQSRLGDRSLVPKDDHRLPDCSHKCIGPAQTGSPNVDVNGRPALRVTDSGVHHRCCKANTWVAIKGSTTVFINNLEAHRLGDADQHCGGPGYMVEGSEDVLVGG
jgi:uncharacterized Zn-binding protein involved in type VI secretion